VFPDYLAIAGGEGFEQMGDFLGMHLLQKVLDLFMIFIFGMEDSEK